MIRASCCRRAFAARYAMLLMAFVRLRRHASADFRRLLVMHAADSPLAIYAASRDSRCRLLLLRCRAYATLP